VDAMRVTEMKIEHMHDDHSWHELQRVEHGFTPPDPERDWGTKRLYRCVDCPEQFRIGPLDDTPP
jgi:hypothetical protein